MATKIEQTQLDVWTNSEPVNLTQSGKLFLHQGLQGVLKFWLTQKTTLGPLACIDLNVQYNFTILLL